MPMISEYVRDGDKKGRPEGNLILAELLAARVIARAAYRGLRFTSLDQIRAAVRDVAGYPMQNRISGRGSRGESTVETEAVYRVSELIGLEEG